MGGREYSTVLSVIQPILFTLCILITCGLSKVALYFCLPALIIGFVLAVFYICIICPLKERNTDGFNYKKCIKYSCDYVVYDRIYFTRLTFVLYIIALVSTLITFIILVVQFIVVFCMCKMA